MLPFTDLHCWSSFSSFGCSLTLALNKSLVRSQMLLWSLKKFPPPKTHAGSLVPFLHSCCLGGWSWAAAALWAWGWSCLQEGEACVLMEVWRRQMSCLLFLSNQEASLFFRATCLQLEFFFKKRDWIPSPLASVQESLPPNSLSCYFARDAFKPGRTFPVNSSTRGGLSLWTLA